MHSTLTRQEAACEALEHLKNDLQEAKFETEKSLFKLKENLTMLDCCKEETDDYEQQSMESDEEMKQHKEETSQMDHMQEKNERPSQSHTVLNDEHEILKSESCLRPGSLLNKETYLTSTALEMVDDRKVCAMAPNAGLSLNTSNFEETNQEKGIITKKPRHLDMQQSECIIIAENCPSQEVQAVEVKDVSEKSQPPNEQGIDMLQEELAQRQRNWKKTEEKMRAELCRRMSQLRETHDQFPSLKEAWEHSHHRQMQKKPFFM